MLNRQQRLERHQKLIALDMPPGLAADFTTSQKAVLCIAPDQRWRYFRVDRPKANMAPPEVGIWRELVSVILPCGESVGACASWNWPDAFAGVATSDMYAVRELARTGAYRADPRAKNWFGHAVAQHFRWNADDKATRARVNTLIATWLKTGALATEKREDPEQRKERLFIVPGTYTNGNGAEADCASDEL